MRTPNAAPQGALRDRAAQRPLSVNVMHCIKVAREDR